MADITDTVEFDLSKLDAKWHEFLHAALAKWDATTFSVRRRLGGKSGATVLLVDLTTPKHNGQGILKLSEDEPLGDELIRQKEALSLAAKLKPHIPQVAHQYNDDLMSAILMIVAGGGLLEAEVMARVSDPILRLASQKVSSSLLLQWNESPTFKTKMEPAYLVLKEWLEYRLSADGRIPVVLNDMGIPDKAPAFRYGGIDYPNPYGFADPEFLGSNIELSVCRGLFHGDLHCENILLSGTQTLEQYFYIDFAHFRPVAPLFFDHAYLELDLLLSQREAVTHQRWQEICCAQRAVKMPQDATKTSNSDDQGMLWKVGMMRHEVKKWIDKEYPQRLEDMKKQLLLARIAVGLNFANKPVLSTDEKISNKKKFFAILYAAEAARELFEYCKIDIPDDGPVARPAGEREAPRGARWRDVWDACGGFQASHGIYVLIAGKGAGDLPEHARKTLGRLPWSMVIDFDSAGSNGRLVQEALPVMSRARAATQIYPHQSASIDFGSCACWFFADSDPDDAEAKPLPISKWRQNTLQPLRKITSDLYRSTVPMPTYLVVLGHEIDSTRLRNAYTTIEAEMGDSLQTVVVSPDEKEEAFVALKQETAEITNVSCDWIDLSLGLHQMIGDEIEARSVWLPVRDPESQIVRRDKLQHEEVAQYSSIFEIVPASGSDYGPDNQSDEIADFHHGNTITWNELNLHRDVDREVTGGADGVLQRIRALLSGSPKESFAIEHSPGAGGTTVARRVAWELRDEFPCVILNAFTDNTVDNIERLFQRSNLPVLVVAEAARVPGALRDILYNDLKGRNVRFVILDVRRRHQPRNTAFAVALSDPMLADDAGRFLSQYEPRAPQNRRELLRRLANDDPPAPYRSAFFFGLYTFERDFLGVPEYVNSLLSELSSEAQQRLAQLALISRYSQERLPIAAFLTLLGLDVSKHPLSPTQLLGDMAAKLVMFDGKRIGISHPLLAEEIVRKYLSPDDVDLEHAWRTNLADFCIEFIEDIAHSDMRESKEIAEILVDLFIERDIWQGSTGSKTFSALLLELPAQESQRRVLEALCEHFPDNAHFWNHLGRHINLSETGSFEEAQEKLKQALELEPWNEIHHHGLGMVYRLEVQRRLRNQISAGETVRQRLQSIEDIFTEAEICFKSAREANPLNQYPLVTPIQMILETFERLVSLSGETNYPAFICGTSYVSDWSREKITSAEGLLARIHHLEAYSTKSQYRITCDAKINEVLGNFEGMVSGLHSLLTKHEVAKAPVRRMLVNAYFRQVENSGETIKDKNLRRIASLMRDNMTEGSYKGHDVRNWFRAFRMLPEFTLTEAIEQMTHWSLISDSIDAHYYLYILYFIQAHRGVHKSVEDAKRHLKILQQRAPTLISQKSYEWWGSDDLRRPCPLIHHSELGPWSREKNFFEGIEKLGMIEGRIDEIRSPQAGRITVNGMPAFFVPKSDFNRTRDLNVLVYLNLGFSYEGLRAWSVRRA